MSDLIYLDYNATTPLDSRVAQAMIPYLSSCFGNPSSAHAFGYEAKSAIETARRKLASLIECAPDELIFTSGGSEANNLAIKGVIEADSHEHPHIITSVIEHPAVAEVCTYLEQQGVAITRLPVDSEGFLRPDDLARTIRANTVLISIMHANNEIGSIQNIAELSQIAQSHSVLFHTDAAQSVGKIPTSVQDLGVDLLTIAGHKFYAPKGVGALYVRRGVRLGKIIHGADHEQNIRAGTENVLEIVGLGKAAELAVHQRESDASHCKALRELFWTKLDLCFNQKTLSGPLIRRNSPVEHCLPNTLSISIRGRDAGRIVSELDTVAVSTGAACHAESVTVSPTLKAIGVPDEYLPGTLRISFGRMTTESEVASAADALIEVLASLEATESTPIASDENHETGDVRLTKYTQGLGCACKMRPQVLERVLSAALETPDDPRLIRGFADAEDGTVYELPEGELLVQSVDFFTPIVDNPFTFGEIAAANALSDIYAMGAKPIFALSIVGFPSARLPEQVLGEIIRGASSKCREAEICIAGGHTIEDREPKFGLVVTGLTSRNKLWMNCGAQVGDALVLTKPLGTGILTTAMKRQLLDPEDGAAVIALMRTLNRASALVAAQFDIHAATDITGFGFLAHLREMLLASKRSARILASRVPVLRGAIPFVEEGIIPGGTINNRDYTAPSVSFEDAVPHALRIVLNDAQTSGGLLFSIPEGQSSDLVSALRDETEYGAEVIGTVELGGTGPIIDVIYGS